MSAQESHQTVFIFHTNFSLTQKNFACDTSRAFLQIHKNAIQLSKCQLIRFRYHFRTEYRGIFSNVKSKAIDSFKNYQSIIIIDNNFNENI